MLNKFTSLFLFFLSFNETVSTRISGRQTMSFTTGQSLSVIGTEFSESLSQFITLDLTLSAPLELVTPFRGIYLYTQYDLSIEICVQ